MEMHLLVPYYVTLLVKPPKMTSLKVLFSELSFPSTKTNNCYMQLSKSQHKHISQTVKPPQKWNLSYENRIASVWAFHKKKNCEMFWATRVPNIYPYTHIPMYPYAGQYKLAFCSWILLLIHPSAIK